MRILMICTLAVTALSVSSCTRPYERSVCDSSCVVVNETYMHKYGVEVPSDDWTSRGGNGQVISTLKNGVTVTKTFSAGKLNGQTSYSFPHSASIEKVETYSNDVLVKDRSFYLSGAPLQETVYHTSKDKEVTTWYENGSPRSVEQYDAAGLLSSAKYYTAAHQLEGNVNNYQGERVNHDSYGQIISKDMIEKGEMATRTTFHPNGAPREVTPYVHNQAEGLKKSYFPDGEPDVFEQWAGGKKQGISTVYLNGAKSAEIPFVNGKKNGVEKRFGDGQHVAEEITWLNDQRNGPSTVYTGDRQTTDWYFQGKLVTKANFELLSKNIMH